MRKRHTTAKQKRQQLRRKCSFELLLFLLLWRWLLPLASTLG